MIRVNRNKQTGKWYYQDMKTGLKSSVEFETRKKAWAKGNAYYDFMYKKK